METEEGSEADATGVPCHAEGGSRRSTGSGGGGSGPAGHSYQSQLRKVVLILIQNGVVYVQNAHRPCPRDPAPDLFGCF